MVGATIDNKDIPKFAGCSWNTSRIHRLMNREDRELYNSSLGRYFEYEQYTQDQIHERWGIHNWDAQTLEMRQQIRDLKWILFYGRIKYQSLHPTHLEPMCDASVSFFYVFLIN